MLLLVNSPGDEPPLQVYTLSAPTKGRAETMHSAAGLFGDSGVSTAPREDLAEDEFAGDDEVSEIEGLQATTDDNTQLVLELLHQMAFKALLKQVSLTPNARKLDDVWMVGRHRQRKRGDPL